MAAPISHIVLANKIIDRELSNFSKDKFFVGTSFPDIRYLAEVKRMITHVNTLSLEDVKKENDTKAGIIFHSFIDDFREKFMLDNGIYNFISHDEITMQSLKFFEDEVVRGQISDWNQVISYFDNIFPEELEYGISKEVVEKWHSILKTYFTNGPNEQARKILVTDITQSDERWIKIEENIAMMKDNDDVLRIVKDFYSKF